MLRTKTITQNEVVLPEGTPIIIVPMSPRSTNFGVVAQDDNGEMCVFFLDENGNPGKKLSKLANFITPLEEVAGEWGIKDMKVFSNSISRVFSRCKNNEVLSRFGEILLDQYDFELTEDAKEIIIASVNSAKKETVPQESNTQEYETTSETYASTSAQEQPMEDLEELDKDLETVEDEVVFKDENAEVPKESMNHAAQIMQSTASNDSGIELPKHAREGFNLAAKVCEIATQNKPFENKVIVLQELLTSLLRVLGSSSKVSDEQLDALLETMIRLRLS